MKNINGAFVLENRLGQVVRTFNIDATKLFVVYRHDNRRIEAVNSLEMLDDAEIPYTWLAETTRDEIRKKPLKVAQAGELKWVDAITDVTPSVEVEEDTHRDFIVALKWTSGVMVATLAFILAIGHFLTAANTEIPEEIHVVKVMPRPEPQRIVEPMQRHRITSTVVKRKSVKPKQVKMANMKFPRHAPKTQTKSLALNQVGALGVLGQMNGSHRDQGGLNLGTVKATRGPGLGGTAGSGGMQTSIYSRGLVAAPLGPGARADGAGGYGTHGKGGGEAGYGTMSLVGSSQAYFQPIEQEAEVDGGLDREQIAAVIQRHLGQIRYCYEQGLQGTPTLSGRVAIRFLIGGTGAVKTAAVYNTSLHAQSVEGCITAHLKSWKFPEPRGGVVVKVTYPFVLKRVSAS